MFNGDDIANVWVGLQKHMQCGANVRLGVMVDFLPARVSCATDEAFAKQPMQLCKILKGTPGILLRLGSSKQQLLEIEGLYSARRVRPTVADAIAMDSPRRIDVGGWADKESKARMSMPNRYSDAR